jgi:serine/threonine protein kinase
MEVSFIPYREPVAATDTAIHSKYFPELFLWHVFHCLAKGYLDFVRARWRSLKPLDFGQQIDGQYLLHNDIKTENVFLATNPSRDEDTVWYPKPKIGDFGLATTTNAGELDANQAKAMQAGTACWHPPVSTNHGPL